MAQWVKHTKEVSELYMAGMEYNVIHINIYHYVLQTHVSVFFVVRPHLLSAFQLIPQLICCDILFLVIWGA